MERYYQITYRVDGPQTYGAYIKACCAASAREAFAAKYAYEIVSVHAA